MVEYVVEIITRLYCRAYFVHLQLKGGDISKYDALSMPTRIRDFNATPARRAYVHLAVNY